MRERLERAGGPGILLVDTTRYRVHDCVPRCVAAPRSADEAAAVLALCSAEGWTVECAGTGSHLANGGRAPKRVDVVITAARMHGIAEYEPSDMTMAALAGTPLFVLQATTVPHRQAAPFDAPDGSLGATIACVRDGPLRTSIGTPRDNVLGLEAVSGDGRVLRFGGRVVKNVAGYDLVRLLIGSRGTLAFITRAHFRLRARPSNDETCVIAGPRSELVSAAQRVGVVLPAALELMPDADAEAWRLYVRLRGSAEEVRYAREQLSALVAGLQPIASSVATTLWLTLHAQESAAPVMVRLAAAPAHLDRTLACALHLAARADRITSAPGLPDGWSAAAHANDGIVRVWRDRPAADQTALADAVLRAREEMREIGGTVHVPTASALPPDVVAWPVDEISLGIMRTLKQALDPAGILAPGRFVT